MAGLSKEEKYEKVLGVCNKHRCCDCPLDDTCNSMDATGLNDKEYCAKLYDKCIDFFEPTSDRPRITIRDIIDLLDYDRTGIRQIRLVDEQTKHTDMLQTDSYLLQYVEDTTVNTLDTVGGVLTMYCDFGEAEHGEA